MNNLYKLKNLNKIINISSFNKTNYIKNVMIFSSSSSLLSTNNGRFYSSDKTLKKPLSIGQPTHETHPHLLKKNEITKGIPMEEFKERRDRLMRNFPIGFAIALFTPPEPMMSYDIPWEFRQNTNFNYLTGFNEPEAVLLLVKTSEIDHQSHLFVRERIAAKEKWDGPRCGSENVQKYFGIDFGYNLTLKDGIPILGKLIENSLDGKIYCNTTPWDGLSDKLQPYLKNVNFYTIETFLQKNRLIKSKNEILMMLNSCEIAGKSFSETMKYVGGNSGKPLNEYQVSAYFEWCVKDKGAKRLSYPPVVAGGDNGHTLHYIQNNQTLVDGELLLMDAGCEYWSYTSDITRTFPINGKFTEAQRDIYEAVLDVNKRCIELCKEGESIESIHSKAIELTDNHLKRLGITNANNPNDYTLYFPHSIGHYLGMDTHDTLDFGYSVKLEPGMIITIEPGIYISKYDQNVPEKYRGISIRIEDNVVIPDSNSPPIVLTHLAPKEISQIESIMSNKI
ncbi:hypothetical protein RB653_006255 [Dictyostelium firmibasis]|uniref:Aminopeptidase P N-terminal domain-containing protein n=1 Tax=Dictyostelium firmibasis TaxID=79012 RepID=A0AAN7UE58_9MYCE